MTWSLILIIALTALFTQAGFKDYSFFRKFDFHIGSIRSGEHIRVLSSGFLHADWTHFGFNMLTLYFFAPIVIQTFGDLSFLMIYLVSLIVGNLLSLLLYQNNYSYRAIGASGAPRSYLGFSWTH